MLGRLRPLPRPQRQLVALHEVDARPTSSVRPGRAARRRPGARSRPTPSRARSIALDRVQRRRSRCRSRAHALDLRSNSAIASRKLTRHRHRPPLGQVDLHHASGWRPPAGDRRPRCRPRTPRPCWWCRSARTRTNTSSSSSKRAGAWYSTCCARITNSGRCGSRSQQAEVAQVLDPGAVEVGHVAAVVDDPLGVGLVEPDPGAVGEAKGRAAVGGGSRPDQRQHLVAARLHRARRTTPPGSAAAAARCWTAAR